MSGAARGIACAEELVAADPRDVRAVFALLNTLGAGGTYDRAVSAALEHGFVMEDRLLQHRALVF